MTEPYIAATKAREQAAAEGAQVFVLITEMSATGAPVSGPLIELAKQLSGFDAVLGNGNAAEFSATINGAQVAARMSRGQSYARTSLRYDRTANKVVSAETAFVRPLVAAVTPDASIAAMLNSYRGSLSARLSETLPRLRPPLAPPTPAATPSLVPASRSPAMPSRMCCVRPTAPTSPCSMPVLCGPG